MREAKQSIGLPILTILIGLSAISAVARAGDLSVSGSSRPVALEFAPPNAPDSIVVPASIPIGASARLLARASDPDGDSVYIRFYYDLGRDTNRHGNWLGPVRSGRFVADTTRYDSAGSYQVAAIARARDTLSPLSVVKTIEIGRVGIAWRYPPTGATATDFNFTPALRAVGSGLTFVYAASGGDTVYMFADSGGPAPGVVRHCLDPEFRPRCADAPSLGSGHVYVSADNFKLYGLDRNDLHQVGEPYPPDNRVYQEFISPAVVGDYLYCGRGDSLMCLYDNGTGLSYVSSYFDYSMTSFPAAVGANGDHVFVGTDTGYLQCLDQNCQEIWKNMVGGSVTSAAAIDDNGNVYVGRADGRLYGYAAGSGPGDTSPIFASQAIVNADIVGCPVIDADGIVYTVRDDGSVRAYPAGPGIEVAPLWTYTPAANTIVSSAPCLAPDSTVIVHDDDDDVYAVRLSDGTEKWRVVLPLTNGRRRIGAGDIGSSPVVGPGNHRIYVGASNDGFFYALAVDYPSYDSGLPRTAWPKYQHDWANTGWKGYVAGVSESPTANPLTPRSISLAAPNPFSGRTLISYALPVPGPVRLEIYNAAGQLVRTLADGRQARSGRGCLAWDGTGQDGRTVGNGMYFCRLTAGGRSVTRSVVLLR